MSLGLTAEQKAGICVVSGFANPELGGAIAHSMGMSLSPIEQKTFPNSELYARFEKSVRGKQVFVVQAHHQGYREVGDEVVKFSINDAIKEQELLVQAAATSSPGEVTAVVPFLGYSRQDRKSLGREPISVMSVLSGLAGNGAHRIVAVDMHSPQIQLGFNGDGRQFDHLTAQPILIDQVRTEISGYVLDECVVVSPDAGATKMAQAFQEELDTGLIHLAKKRKRGQSDVLTRDESVADVDGRVCVIPDDMIDTAGTISTAVEALKNSGARAVIVVATHGLFSANALAKLNDSGVDKVVVTDTIPMDRARSYLGSKLVVVRVAPMIGRALMEIAVDGSVSKLFQGKNHA